MDSKELLKSITESFYSAKNSYIAFISLSENLMNSYINLVSGDVKFIDLKSETTPLAPFLKICMDLDISFEYVQNNTYKLQTDSFASFLNNGYPNERLDPIIIEEIDYEKLRIKETIVHFIKSFFSGKIIVLNAQNMSENALAILSSLNDERIDGKLIFCFNSMEMEALSPQMQSFLQKINSSSSYYSINTLEDINYLKKSAKKKNKTNYKALFNQLRSYRTFLDIAKAYELTKKIESSNLLMEANKSDERLIYLEMGIISFFHGDMDLSTFFLSNIIESQIEDSVECWALYFMAYVASRKNMTSLSLRYIAKAISKAKKIDDKRLYALSSMLEYIITEREESEYSTEKYFNVLKLLEEQNLINNKIFTSLIIPYGIMYNQELRRKMLVQVEKAMSEARELIRQ